MNIGSLLRTLGPLTESIQSTGLVQAVQSAYQGLTRSAQPASGGIQRAPSTAHHETIKTELLLKIEMVSAALSGQEHVEALGALGATQLLGSVGYVRIESVFAEARVDLAAARGRMRQYQQELQRLIQLNEILSGFAPTLEKVSIDTVPENMIDIHFQGQTAIGDLRELEKAAKRWNQVLIGFAMLTRENDTAFRIHTIRRGSIIFELIAYGQIAKSIGEATIKVLDVIKKALDTWKVALELRKLANPDLAKNERDVEAAAKIKVRTEATRISSELTNQYGWTEEDKRGDVSTAVRLAVEHMLKFMNNGGEVNIRLLSTSEGDRSIEVRLKEKRGEVALAQQEVARLSGTPDPLALTEGDDADDSESDSQIEGVTDGP